LSRLRHGIPRAFKTHKSPQGRLYSAYCRAKLARYGPLAKDALLILREAGRTVVQLDWLNRECDHAMERRRLSDCRRFRREIKVSRFMLLRLEQQLERLAGVKVASDPMAELFDEEIEA
jgi:hypothetical protein